MANDDVTKIGIELGSTFDGSGFRVAASEVDKLKAKIKQATAEIQGLGDTGQEAAAPVIEAQKEIAKEIEKVGEEAKAAGEEIKQASEQAATATDKLAEATEAATAATTESSESILEMGKESAKTASAGESMGRKMSEAMRRNRQETSATANGAKGASEAFSSLDNAARGGATGVLKLRDSMKAFAAAWAANPITAAIATFLLLKDYAVAAGKAFGDLVVKSRSLADSINGVSGRAEALRKNLESIEGAGEASLKKIAREAKAAADDLERFVRGVSEAQSRLNALDDAATAAKLAALDLAEAQALANASTSTEKEGITQRFASERAGVRDEAERRRLDRTQRFEEDRRQEASAKVTEARRRIEQAQVTYNVQRNAFEGQIAQNRNLSADTPEGQQALQVTAIMRAKLQKAEDDLAAARAQNQPIIDRGKNEMQGANDAITINANRRAETESKSKADRTNRETQGAERMAQARDADRKAELDRRQREAEAEQRAREADAGAIGSRVRTGVAAATAAGGLTPETQRALAEADRAAASAEKDGGTEEELRLLREKLMETTAIMRQNGQASAGLGSIIQELDNVGRELKRVNTELEGLKNSRNRTM